MRLTILDAKMMTDKISAHEYLAKILELPDYYGKNLDALSDCLSEMDDSDFIVIEHSAELAEKLGSYGESMLRVFRNTSLEGGPRVYLY